MAKRRAENWILALPVLLALAACGTGSSSSRAPTTGAALPPAGTPEPTPLTPSGGFIAMPSPQQVVEAQPHGRVDPFAPVVAATATEERTSSELQLTGLIGSGRSAQALISLGSQSGTVCVGRQGLCPGSGLPALLPPGWTVTGIDLGRGELRLNQAGQQRVLSL